MNAPPSRYMPAKRAAFRTKSTPTIASHTVRVTRMRLSHESGAVTESACVVRALTGRILRRRAAAPIGSFVTDPPCGSEVRDDAFVARLQIHSSLPGGTLSTAE